MPCFVITTMADGKRVFARGFTDRVPALEYIRFQLARKSLVCSAWTYTIYSDEGGETFNEANPA